MGNGASRARAVATALAVCLSACAVAAASSAGAGKKHEPSSAPELPYSFTVAATNGYEATVFGQDGAENDEPGHDLSLLLLRSKHEAVAYVTAGNVTRTSIKAVFGDVARVDMTFHPSGKARYDHSQCESGGHPLDSGTYQGQFEFHGEDGYAEASATKVQGSFAWFFRAICEGQYKTVNSKRGAELDIQTPGGSYEWPPQGKRHRVELRVNKNSPGARVRFNAQMEEDTGEMFVTRAIERWAKPGTFAFAPSYEHARVRPPAPFSGSATYAGSPPGNWEGDLAVDFPGRSGVALTSPGLGGELIPARLVHGSRQDERASVSSWPTTRLSPIASAMSSPLAPR